MIIRYVKWIAVLTALFLINACGGGSSGADGGTVSSMEASQKEVTLFEADPIKISKSANESLRSTTSVSGSKDFTALAVFRKELNGNYSVAMHDFSFNVEGCTVSDVRFDPSVLTMDGNANSLYRLAISGKIDSQCAQDASNRPYTVGSKIDVTLGGKTTTQKRDFVSSETESSAGAGEGGSASAQGYAFYNANTPLKIAQPQKHYPIKVQLLKEGYVVVGATVMLKPFDARYGSVSTYTTKTGSDGYAVFDYTSPETLPAKGTSTTVEMTFLDENNQTISQDITLDFNKSSGDDGSDVQHAKLINFPREINVTVYKKYNIDFQLVDKNGLAIREAEVTVKGFDNHYGSVASRYGSTQTTPDNSRSSQYVITDEDGVGRFIYTPPAVMPQNGITFDLELFYLDENITQPVTLKFMQDSNISNGRAATLSIVYGYKPPKGYIPPESGDSSDLGTGDRQEPAEWDGEQSKMVNYYAVHAVDKDSRRPIEGMEIRMSLINGIKEISGIKVQSLSGQIEKFQPIRFVDTNNSKDFLDPTLYSSQKVEVYDNLLILPSVQGMKSSYLGGWKITAVDHHSLTLYGDDYSNLTTESNLSYIIGNERRLLGRNIVVADVERIDEESITDEYGMAYFKVTFDPELAGHTMTLEAHGVDVDNNRVGISRIASFRWDEYTGGPVTIDNIGGIQYVPMTLSIVAGDKSLHHLIDMEIVPSSFTVKKTPFCSLNKSKSNFHTDAGGTVLLAINTDGNTSSTGGEDTCTIEWAGTAGSMYFEY